MSLLSHPFHWLALLGVVGAVVLLVAVIRCRGAALRVVLLLLALVSLSPAALIVLATYFDRSDVRIEAYQAFYAAIQPGMTKEEVLALRDRHYPAGGPRQPPRLMIDEADSLSFFMHPEDPESTVDCEAILLSLANGRVTQKTYTPD